MEVFRSTQKFENHTLPEVRETIQLLNLYCNQTDDAGLHTMAISNKDHGATKQKKSNLKHLLAIITNFYGLNSNLTK